MDAILEFISKIPPWAEVRVRWRDAYSPASGWHDVSDYETTDTVATTLGRVWQNCQDNYLTLVGTIFESELPNPETVGDINHIPVAWITDIKIIGA